MQAFSVIEHKHILKYFTLCFYYCFEMVLIEPQAFGLAQRLEIHYTPKHGSWLNIAEIELSAFTSQCLNRRIASLSKMRNEVKSWATKRNLNQKSVDWQFDLGEARCKLKHLYPVINTD